MNASIQAGTSQSVSQSSSVNRSQSSNCSINYQGEA
jgi:hypothetical protein